MSDYIQCRVLPHLIVFCCQIRSENSLDFTVKTNYFTQQQTWLRVLARSVRSAYVWNYMHCWSVFASQWLHVGLFAIRLLSWENDSNKNYIGHTVTNVTYQLGVRGSHSLVCCLPGRLNKLNSVCGYYTREKIWFNMVLCLKISGSLIG